MQTTSTIQSGINQQQQQPSPTKKQLSPDHPNPALPITEVSAIDPVCSDLYMQKNIVSYIGGCELKRKVKFMSNVQIHQFCKKVVFQIPHGNRADKLLQLLPIEGVRSKVV